jgi:hypothetical protein
MFRNRPTASLLFLLASCVVAATARAQVGPPQPSEPEEFGTLAPGFTTVLGNQHNPLSNGHFSSSNGLGDIYHVSGFNAFDAQLQMPSGAIFQEVRWWGRDDNASSLGGSIYRLCQPAAAGEFPTPTFLGLGSSAALPGEFSFAVAVDELVIVDNESCAYFARTTFGDTGVELRLYKVRAQWQRQVSPAPAVATFPNDTPTSHPFFRFVEALAAAGITAGCAPDSFCPETPITRGQMAVFLSLALGLHWPN